MQGECLPTGVHPGRQMTRVSQVGLIAHTSAPKSSCFTIFEAPSSAAVDVPICHQALRLGAVPLLMGCCPPRPPEFSSARPGISDLGRLLSTPSHPVGVQPLPDCISVEGPRFCSCGQVWSARGTKVADPDLVACGPARVSEKQSWVAFHLWRERQCCVRGGLQFGVRSN